MPNSNRVGFEPLQSLAFGGIGAAYAPIGTALTSKGYILIVNNYTDAILVFSKDGVNDHFVLDAGSSMTIDMACNKDLKQDIHLSVGDIFYVKRIEIPTVGSVYITIMIRE